MKTFYAVMALCWFLIAAVILFLQRDVDWWAALAMSVTIAFNCLKDTLTNDR